MKNTIVINAGRVRMTKYNPLTGALSTDPKDIRICTETIQEIQKDDEVDTYDLPDGNSNYVMGKYEKGATKKAGITFSSLSKATIAFLKRQTIVKKTAEPVRDIQEIEVPLKAPFEIVLPGKPVGEVEVIDLNNEIWELAETEPLTTKQYKVAAGVGEEPSKITFHEEDAGIPLIISGEFEIAEVTVLEESSTPILETVMMEIVHETMSSDKTTKYKNVETLPRMQWDGKYNETLAREHKPQTLWFELVKPGNLSEIHKSYKVS